MNTQSQAVSFTGVQHAEERVYPLGKLKKSPRNVRKVAHAEADIEARAASIKAKGLISPLVVEPELGADGAETGYALVTAGEGRRLALRLLAKRKVISKTTPVRCLVRYGLDGRVYEIGEAFQGLREPAKPITAEITALTGIDEAMVAGQSIDVDAVAAFAAPAALVVAHNAAFDRRFLERFCDVFSTKPWACSMSQVEWAAEGHEGVKLAWLAAGAGFFYDRHRAVNDCAAAIELLAADLPRSGGPALAALLERARTPTWRIWAENAPFAMKDRLKARGYRWNGDDVVPSRCWYVDVSDADKDAELSFLRQEIYGGEIDLRARRIDAHDRFSERC